jgi:hypothetical protein
MAGMQQIKATVGEHQLFPLGMQEITQAPDISGSGGRIFDGHVLLMACDRVDARHEHAEKANSPRQEQKSGGLNLRFFEKNFQPVGETQVPLLTTLSVEFSKTAAPGSRVRGQ